MSDHAADDAVPEVDESRRKFLIAATAGTGAVGAVLTAVPFVASWKPSESARAAGLPTEIDLSQDRAGPDGDLLLAQAADLRGQAHAGDAGFAALARRASSRTRNPRSPISPPTPRTTQRALRPDVLVLIGTCTHLGCLPKTRFTPDDAIGDGELAGRLLLSLPRFEVRPRRSRVRRFAGLGEPEDPAVFVPGRQQARHRRRRRA